MISEHVFFLGISHFSLHFPGVFCFSVRQVLSQVQREADVALILKLKCARRRDGVVFGGKNRSRFAPLQKWSGRRLLCFCLMYCTILYKYVLVYVQTCTCLLFLELLRLFSWWFSSKRPNIRSENWPMFLRFVCYEPWWFDVVFASLSVASKMLFCSNPTTFGW